jgi:hypothetical protein
MAVNGRFSMDAQNEEVSSEAKPQAKRNLIWLWIAIPVAFLILGICLDKCRGG